MEENPLVSVCCITFNQVNYIRQCIEGFLMQKTNFEYEILINDDCSTDGTTEVVKEYAEKYPKLIKPIFHEENQYSKGVRGICETFVYPKARGKYIALCEGDDYWTDPLKLQKQVDFLEADNSLSCCFARVRHIDKNGVKLSGIFPPAQTCFRPGRNKLKVFLHEDFVRGKWSIQLSGFVIRKVVVESLMKMRNGPLKKYPFGDYPLFITAFLIGDSFLLMKKCHVIELCLEDITL